MIKSAYPSVFATYSLQPRLSMMPLSLAVTRQSKETVLVMDASNKESNLAPTVSVVTVIKGGDQASFISRLGKQSYSTPFEVIVVEGGNRSQARNFAITRSEAPVVAFIDADCETGKDWLANLVSALPGDQIVAGVGGVSSYQGSLTSLEKAIDGVFSTYAGSLNSPSLISYPKAQRSFVRALSGHNCIFRRYALIEVGGFDERFELNEDTDICARLREKRYKLLLDQGIFVYHKRRTHVKDFAKQFFWYGIGRMRSMLTSRRYVDKRILGLLLAAIFLVLLTPLTLLPILAALSGYSILILYGSVVGARRIHAIGSMLWMVVLFAVEHLSYLVGLLCGIFLGSWNKSNSTGSLRLIRYRVALNSIVEASTEIFELNK